MVSNSRFLILPTCRKNYNSSGGSKYNMWISTLTKILVRVDIHILYWAPLSRFQILRNRHSSNLHPARFKSHLSVTFQALSQRFAAHSALRRRRRLQQSHRRRRRQSEEEGGARGAVQGVQRLRQGRLPAGHSQAR